MRIVENAVPGFAELQDAVLAPGFPWYFARATKKDDGEPNPYLQGWVHLVCDQGQWFSKAGEMVMAKVVAAMDAAGEPIQTVYRLRLVLNTIAAEPLLTGPHVDFTWPHRTALIYLNDADGDTVLYQERWREGYGGPFTEAARITPKANRMALFEGLQFHTGALPTRTARRVVLNVNYD